jgi:hypothetical protein
VRQNVRLQGLCATFNRAWHVELELESSPFVAFATKLETINEPLFLEVEEAKRFLLLIAHCGFSSQLCQRSGCAELHLRRRALWEAYWGFPSYPTRGKSRS